MPDRYRPINYRERVLSYLTENGACKNRCTPTFVATMVSRTPRGFDLACVVINTLVASGAVTRSNVDGQITLSLPASSGVVAGSDTDDLPSS